MSFYNSSNYGGHICGLYYNFESYGHIQKTYLPQVELQAHATVLATTARTVLTQTFLNPSTEKGIREVRYTFPLYDGVSVVGFTCQVGGRTIVGEVKEKEKARAVYKEAVAKGQTAGLFEQLPDASDVFTTTVGNIPPGAKVMIVITYLGELKHDMEVDGIRFTIPTIICPRYGNYPGGLQPTSAVTVGASGISITVDADMADGSFIQKIQSPTHPISMTMGTTSIAPDAEPTMSRASASLTLGTAELDEDFVVQVIAKNTGVPRAVLENHPTIPNHRALMATLVPRFALPAEKPELVFICDRSGSMNPQRMRLAIQALKVFLKSLPVGVKFNICSFGTRYSFLWEKSVTYSQETLDEAIRHAESFASNYGGTEMLEPVKATIDQRYKDMPLDVVLLTDGEIWHQQKLFSYLNKAVTESKAPIRIFTLGIGNGVSHALIEGVAKAGNGFSQTVGEGEKMDTKVVRMLKGALSPHVNDYTLEVKYANATSDGEDEDFEIIERVIDSLKVKLDLSDREAEAKKVSDDQAARDMTTDRKQKMPISLFDTSADLDKAEFSEDDDTGEQKYAHLPNVAVPKIIQAPQNIPSLFAFNRTTAYLLLGPDAPKTTPKSVVLRGTSTHGPLELEIPIQILDQPGETFHQLAAKKAISELEQGRGWLSDAKDEAGVLLKTKFEGRFDDMVEREAVRLGVQFQVGGKWCSFVAVESNERAKEQAKAEAANWAWLEDEAKAKAHGESTVSSRVSGDTRFRGGSKFFGESITDNSGNDEGDEDESDDDFVSIPAKRRPGRVVVGFQAESDSDSDDSNVPSGANRFLRDTDSRSEDGGLVDHTDSLALKFCGGGGEPAESDEEDLYGVDLDVKFLQSPDPKLNVSSKDMAQDAHKTPSRTFQFNSGSSTHGEQTGSKGDESTNSTNMILAEQHQRAQQAAETQRIAMQHAQQQAQQAQQQAQQRAQQQAQFRAGLNQQAQQSAYFAGHRSPTNSASPSWSSSQNVDMSSNMFARINQDSRFTASSGSSRRSATGGHFGGGALNSTTSSFGRSTSGAYGSTNSMTAGSPFGQSQPATGGSFGAPITNPAAGPPSGLFGGAATNTGAAGGFESSTAGGGGLFGNNQAQAQAQAAPKRQHSGLTAAQTPHQQQDHSMQLMLLEQQNKKRLLMVRQEQDEQDRRNQSFHSPPPPPAQHEIFAGNGLRGAQPTQTSEDAKKLQDYQMSLMLLEQQNKGRRFMATTRDDGALISPPPPPPPQKVSFGSAPTLQQSSKSAPIQLTGQSYSAFGSSLDGAAPSFDLANLGFDNGAALENFDFDSFLQNPNDGNLGALSVDFDFNHVPEAVSAPPPLSPGFSGQSPQSPASSPASPPNPSCSPQSPTYTPTSPGYPPASPGNSHQMQSGGFSAYGGPTSSHTASPHASPVRAKKKRRSVKGLALSSQAQPSALRAPQVLVPRTPEELNHYLISLQTFEGSWELSNALLDALHFEEEELFKLADELHVHVSVVITAAVVTIFEKKLRQFEGSWELLVEKSKAWLEEQGLVESDHRLELWLSENLPIVLGGLD
jgi:hypothetical protein